MLGRGLRVRATLVARTGQHQIWRGRGAFACFSTSIQAASSSEKHIAVVGGGAAGLYTASRLLAKAQDIRIDVFEQLPTPYGLVRFGVAPDHPEVKNCTTKFAQVCDDSRVRLFGNIKIGNGPLLSLERLLSVYDGVVLSYGASEDRKLGIPGEDRAGVVSAREFVAWYNGLPEAQELNPDLESSDRVVIVGQGNVGLDCARILLTDPEDLAKTDITARALDRLRRSKVRHVEMVGRRGPLQVAFTTKELREMTKIPGVAFICDRELVARECERWAGQVEKNRSLKRMMDLLLKHATGDPVGGAAGKERSFTLRFLRSPVEVEGGPERGAALGVRFRVNRLEEGAGEAARA
ncbi:NADPH-adrenodoxin reductase, partial [Coemansia sp. RSA 2322]